MPPPPPASPNETPEEAKRRDDAILLETLVLGSTPLSFSTAGTFSGLAFFGTGVPYIGGSAVYVARGGPFANVIGPSVFGIGSMATGGYYFLTGGDLLALQVALGLALRDDPSPEAILATFEPRLERVAWSARRRRKTFALGLLGISALTTAAATWAAVEPVPRLEGGLLPSLLFGVAAVDALAALTLLTYESPAETAWNAYLRNTTWK